MRKLTAMSYKWEEETTTNFLIAYEKYPCLWNPYDKDYYNCLAKNDALKSIIQELHIPELNVIDCLQQIRIIREKYGREQLRTMKSLKLQKPYKSPFPWYDLVAQMLTKVIHDEDRHTSRNLLKTPTSEISVRHRQLEKEDVSKFRKQGKKYTISQSLAFPCSNTVDRHAPHVPIKSKENVSMDTVKPVIMDRQIEFDVPSTDRVSLPDKDTNLENIQRKQIVVKNIKQDVHYVSAQLPSADNNEGAPDNAKNNINLQWSQCPACGWEDKHKDEVETDGSKVVNQRSLIKNTNNLVQAVDRSGENIHKIPNYVLCPYASRNYIENHVGDPRTSELPASVCTNRIGRLHEGEVIHRKTDTVKEKLNIFTKGDTDKVVQCNRESMCNIKGSGLTSTTLEIPEVEAKRTISTVIENGTLEAYSHFRIVLPSQERLNLLTAATTQKCSRDVQAVPQTKQETTATIEQDICTSKAQCLRNVKEVEVSTTENVDRAEQTVSNEHQFSSCVKHVGVITTNLTPIHIQSDTFCQRSNSRLLVKDLKETRINIDRCTSNEVQSSRVCTNDTCTEKIKGKSSDFVLLTPTGKYVPLTQIETQPTEKQGDACTKNTCPYEAIRNAKWNIVMTSIMLQCLDKVLNLQDKIKIRAVASFLSKKTDLINHIDSDESICTPCKTEAKYKSLARKANVNAKPGGLESMSSLEETRMNNAVGVLTKTFLDVLKCALDLDNKNRSTGNDKCKCFDEIRTTDTETLKTNIEKCITKVVEVDRSADFSENRLLNEFCLIYNAKKQKSEESGKKLRHKEAQVVEKDTDNVEGVEEVEEISVMTKFKPTVSQDKGQYVSESDTAFLESIEEAKPRVQNKGVYVHSKSRDVGVNGASSRYAVSDKQTQSIPKLLTDSCVLTKYCENNIKMRSIGTQKRDPILVRVIRYSNEQEIIKPIKAVSMCNMSTNTEILVDKNIETARAYRKNATRKYCAKTPSYTKDYSNNLRYEEMSPIDYDKTLLSDQNFACGPDCKYQPSIDYDWTKVDTVSGDTFCSENLSKIPLCMKLHKHVRRKDLNKKEARLLQRMELTNKNVITRN